MPTILSTCGCWCLLISAMNAADDKPQPPIELPEEATAEVISLDFKGGFTPPRLRNSPSLSILRDGTVLIPDNYGQSETVKAKLTDQELQELLAFIIQTHEFFEFDEAEVQQQIKESQKPKKDKNGNITVSITPQIADAPTTVIKVETADQEHEAKWYALSMAASHHPQIESLQHLRAIEMRLQRVMTIAHAGGNAEVDKQLKLVNAEVKRQHPDAPPLTAEHLVSASRLGDGGRQFFWQWIVQEKDGNAQSARFVTVQQKIDAAGTPTYNINAKLK